jgi:hypothetical protein
MDSRKALDRAKIEEAFRVMGQFLLDRKALGEIAIYGGSAILFQFDWRRTSQDVDARVISASHHGLVIRAAEEAARRRDLPRSWLNESVAMYALRDVFKKFFPEQELPAATELRFNELARAIQSRSSG